MGFSSANTPGNFVLTLTLLQVLCFAEVASADRVIINNGLAPPFPDNVLDGDTYLNDGVYIRNVSCGDVAACRLPQHVEGQRLRCRRAGVRRVGRRSRRGA
jgi:hypothetical protein